MSKLSKPVRFSKHYGVSPDVLKKHGAFDPILNADTPLFIDAMLLRASKQPEMKQADATWDVHFRDLVKLLAVATGPADAAYRAALRKLTFPEFKGTCLGYGEGIDGSGIGPALAKNMMDTAERAVKLGVQDPAFFALIPVMENDLGADRISDMTTRLIAKELCAYTVRVLKNETIPRKSFDVLGTTFELPVNTFAKDLNGGPLPVVLTPLDVLRNLPIAMDWSEVSDAAAQNAKLRETMSGRIAEQFADASTEVRLLFSRSETKQERKQLLLADKDRLIGIIKLLKEKVSRGLDIEPELEGLVQWVELGQQFAKDYPLQLAATTRNAEGLKEIVGKIIDHFQCSIEKGGWKALYDSDGSPRNEKTAQLIFFMIAESWCEANNVGISPETDQGGGPVDFKFSTGYANSVLVEMKLSSNNKLFSGYTRQLEVYKKAERTDAAFYLIMDNGKGEKQIKKVIDQETDLKNSKQKYSEVRVVDATKKVSASNR
jgi:hypothetical protein